MSRLNWDFGSPVGNGAVASLPSLGGVAFFVLMSRRPGEGLAMGRRGGVDRRCLGDARPP